MLAIEEENLGNSGLTLYQLEKLLLRIDDFKTEGVKGVTAE